MKRNIYSYSKLWMIFFVLMGAACTNQVEDAIPVSGQPIEFSVQSDWKEISNTRSDDGKTQFVKDDEIQIFGFHTSPSNVVQKFMYREDGSNRGQIVKFDGTSWNYSPKRFWPKEGTLDFYASYPQNSIHNDADHRMMIYEQTANSMKQDLLWGVSIKKCADDRKKNVEITMKHALAKVNIFFDKSWGDIGTVMFYAYTAGRFTETDTDGIPKWINDGDKTTFNAKFGFDDLLRDDPGNPGTSLTVFILPGNITGFQMFDFHGDKIVGSDEISNEIQKKTFEAGKPYKITISKSNGVRKKNTNSRSIAMSVRCVSE